MLQRNLGTGRKILQESAFQSHVEHLEPLAYSQEGHFLLESLPGKGNLKPIEKGEGRSQIPFRLRSPEKRMHISSSGKNQALHSLQLFLQGFEISKLGEHQRSSSGILHRPNVGIGYVTTDLSLGGMSFVTCNADNTSIYHDIFLRSLNIIPDKGSIPAISHGLLQSHSWKFQLILRRVFGKKDLSNRRKSSPKRA